MGFFKTIIFYINLISALLLIFLVLIQHGKGADAGAGFGSGNSAKGIFGAGGSANFLSRATSVCVMIFFTTCLALAFITSKSHNLNMKNIMPKDYNNAPNVNTTNNKPSVNLEKNNQHFPNNKIPE